MTIFSQQRSNAYLILLLIMIAPVLAATGWSQKNKPYYLEYVMTKVRDSVYQFSASNPFRVVQGNVTVIINKKDVVVIDASSSPDAGKHVIQQIKKLTSNPVRCLIITHWHGDHLFGTQAFEKTYPGIQIISSKFTRDYFINPGIAYPATFVTEDGFNKSLGRLDVLIQDVESKKEPGYQNVLHNLNQKKFYDYSVIREQYKKVLLTMPTQVFEGKMILYHEGREIQLLQPGFGDTAGDVWVYLPREKVLITGDAVVMPIPYGYTAEPFEWMNTLKKMAEFEVDFMIPGHGPIQSNKEYLTQLIEALETIKERITLAITQGKSLEDVTREIDLTDLENKFSHGDPVTTFYFRLYFVKPIIPGMYNKLKPPAPEK